MGKLHFYTQKKAIADNFFVFIIGIMLVVVLFIAGIRVMNNLFCMNAISATSHEMERLREIINRVYAGAEQSIDSFEVSVTGDQSYCFRIGEVYVEGSCVAESFTFDNLIVYNTFVDENIRAQVDEMAVIIDRDESTLTESGKELARDRSVASTICVPPGFYNLKFERTATKVNLQSIYGMRDKDYR